MKLGDSVRVVRVRALSRQRRERIQSERIYV